MCIDLYEMMAADALAFPAINVNDSGHQVEVRQPVCGCHRHSLTDGILRARLT